MTQAKKQPTEPKEAISADDKIIEDLLSNLPSTEEIVLELPSKNKFYTLKDPAKPITIRPLTFEDEKKMMSSKQGGSKLLNSLLTACVSNIDISQVLQLDKLYMLMKLREVSYGEEYGAKITCPSCKNDNHIVFNLSELPVTYVDEDMLNPTSVYLPVLQKTIKVKLPTIADESYLLNSEIAMANLWRFVTEIEGHVNKKIISQVIQKLPLKDAHVLLKVMGGEGLGINTNVKFSCSYCSLVEEMELPIGADFFTDS
jgi:hypothetical protein